MEQLKEYIRSYTSAPFLVRKNNNKFFKGYTHTIFLKHTTTRDFKEKLSELGFVYSMPMIEGGSYPYRIHIKHVGANKIREGECGYLWVCPECGGVLVLSSKPKHHHHYPYFRYVCSKCERENDDMFKKVEV